MKRSLLSGCLFALAGTACMTQAPRAYPLYPNPEQARPDDQVGVLDGPIAEIDGQEVADKGRTFALAPGCHAFRLLRTVGDVSMGGGASYVAPLPQNAFALDVQPGHLYTFDSVVHPMNAPDGSWNWGFADHRRDGSVAVARACDGSALPASPNIR